MHWTTIVLSISTCLLTSGQGKLENRQNSGKNSGKKVKVDFLHFADDPEAVQIIDQFKESLGQQGLEFGTVTAIESCQSGQGETETAGSSGAEKASQAARHSSRDINSFSRQTESRIHINNLIGRPAASVTSVTKVASTANCKGAASNRNTCTATGTGELQTAAASDSLPASTPGSCDSTGAAKSSFWQSGSSLTPAPPLVVSSLLRTATNLTNSSSTEQVIGSGGAKIEAITVDSGSPVKRPRGRGRGRPRNQSKEVADQLTAPTNPELLDCQIVVQGANDPSRCEPVNKSSPDFFPTVTISSLRSSTARADNQAALDSSKSDSQSRYQVDSQLRRRSRDKQEKESAANGESSSKQARRDPEKEKFSASKNGPNGTKQSSAFTTVTKAWTTDNSDITHNEKGLSKEKNGGNCIRQSGCQCSDCRDSTSRSASSSKPGEYGAGKSTENDKRQRGNILSGISGRDLLPITTRSMGIGAQAVTGGNQTEKSTSGAYRSTGGHGTHESRDGNDGCTERTAQHERPTNEVTNRDPEVCISRSSDKFDERPKTRASHSQDSSSGRSRQQGYTYHQLPRKGIRASKAILTSGKEREKSTDRGQKAWQQQQQHVTVTIPTNDEAQKYKDDCRIRAGGEKQHVQRVIRELKASRNRSGPGKSADGNGQDEGNAADGTRHPTEYVPSTETDCTPTIESAASEETVRNVERGELQGAVCIDRGQSINKETHVRSGRTSSDECESIQPHDTINMSRVRHEFTDTGCRTEHNLRSASIGSGHGRFTTNDQSASSSSTTETQMAGPPSIAEISGTNEFMRANVDAFLKWGVNTGRLSFVPIPSELPMQVSSSASSTAVINEQMPAADHNVASVNQQVAAYSQYMRALSMTTTPSMHAAEMNPDGQQNPPGKGLSIKKRKGDKAKKQKGPGVDMATQIAEEKRAHRLRVERAVAIAKTERQLTEMAHSADSVFMALTMADVKLQMMKKTHAADGRLDQVNRDQYATLPRFAFKIVWEMPGDEEMVFQQNELEEDIHAVATIIANHLLTGRPVRLQRAISNNTKKVEFNNPMLVTLRRNKSLNGADLDYDTYLTRNDHVRDHLSRDVPIPRQLLTQSATAPSTTHTAVHMYATVKRGYGEPPMPRTTLPLVQMVQNDITKQLEIKVFGHIPRGASMIELQRHFTKMLVAQPKCIINHKRSDAMYCPQEHRHIDSENITYGHSDSEGNASTSMPPPANVMSRWPSRSRSICGRQSDIDEMIMEKILQWKRVEKQLVEVLLFHFNPNQEPRQPLRPQYPRGVGSLSPNMSGHVNAQPNVPNGATMPHANGAEFWKDCGFCNTKEATHHFFIRCAHCDCEGHILVDQNPLLTNCNVM